MLKQPLQRVSVLKSNLRFSDLAASVNACGLHFYKNPHSGQKLIPNKLNDEIAQKMGGKLRDVEGKSKKEKFLEDMQEEKQRVSGVIDEVKEKMEAQNSQAGKPKEKIDVGKKKQNEQAKGIHIEEVLEPTYSKRSMKGIHIEEVLEPTYSKRPTKGQTKERVKASADKVAGTFKQADNKRQSIKP